MRKERSSSDSRDLLGDAVDAAAAIGKWPAGNAEYLPVGEDLSKDPQGSPVLRVSSGGDQHAPVSDIEVQVADRRRGDVEGDHLQPCRLQNPSMFGHLRQDTTRPDKRNDVVGVAVGLVVGEP